MVLMFVCGLLIVPGCGHRGVMAGMIRLGLVCGMCISTRR